VTPSDGFGYGSILTGLLAVIAVLMLFPSLTLFVEIVVARLPRRSEAKGTDVLPRMAVLVPAHNEASLIRSTVLMLKEELGPQDRLIVIADNCGDETAAIARGAGAEVIVRNDRALVGKGFAISCGVDNLRDNPPDVVVLVDADCQITQGRLLQLAWRAQKERLPVQADYLLTASPTSQPLSLINAFAVLVRNRVRPLGLYRLARVCQLTGSGMAFPWAILQGAPSMKGNLVEDLALGLALTLQGFPPRLCSDVTITSRLPLGSAASLDQRRRWEHGHLHTIRCYVPLLVSALLRSPNRALLGMAFDLMVPPLSLLVLAHLVVLVLAALGAAGGYLSPLPLLLASASLTLLGLSVALAWFRFGRAIVPLSAILRFPLYVFWKIGIYVSLVVKGKQKTWNRTERDMPVVDDIPGPTPKTPEIPGLATTGTCGPAPWGTQNTPKHGQK
jgi:cellulose synthase/poly-beta-1,6-N-acetylglucosamine synthase-like glycosyltransferase